VRGGPAIQQHSGGCPRQPLLTVVAKGSVVEVMGGEERGLPVKAWHASPTWSGTLRLAAGWSPFPRKNTTRRLCSA
jgi:hypothetical protein